MRKRKTLPILNIIPIKVTDLVPSTDNFYSTEEIADLKMAIEMFGVLHNLVVKPIENVSESDTTQKYQILDGERRYKACMELIDEGKREFEYVPCRIQAEPDNIKERILMILTNSTGRDFSDYERMKQASELQKHFAALKKRDGLPGRVRDLVSESLNTSQTQLARLYSIEKNLIPSLMEHFKNNNIGVSVAYEVSGMPEEKQRIAEQMLTSTGSLTLADITILKHGRALGC